MTPTHELHKRISELDLVIERLVRLNQAHVDALRAILRHVAVHGGQYPDFIIETCKAALAGAAQEVK